MSRVTTLPPPHVLRFSVKPVEGLDVYPGEFLKGTSEWLMIALEVKVLAAY